MKLQQADRQKLNPLLDELAKAIEDLLLTGLTTASESTRQTLNVSFQEASRMGLLRLGSSLRVACEELSRYTRDRSEFSRKRYMFWLNRSWLLTRGLSAAIKQDDNDEFERLTWNPQTRPVSRLEVVTVGVGKKFVPSSFCAFELRLRSIDTTAATDATDEHIPFGQNLVWSTVFPLKPGQDIPPEAFLHLPQKQKFNVFHFLEGKRVIIENAALIQEKTGTTRISLNEKSIVTQGDKFDDWKQFAVWNPDDCIRRLKSYEPGPMDLEVELQEEVFFDDWQIGQPLDSPSNPQISYPFIYKDSPLEIVVTRGAEGNSLKSSIEKLSKAKQKPTLFGLMHYERCKLIVQPLAILGKDAPEYITLSKDKVDRAALLKVLKF